MNRKELEKLSMSELRKIGAPLGAKDTKKSELIDEILAASGKAEDTMYIITQLGLLEGDVIETYKLRPKILEKLNKLYKLELRSD